MCRTCSHPRSDAAWELLQPARLPAPCFQTLEQTLSYVSLILFDCGVPVITVPRPSLPALGLRFDADPEKGIDRSPCVTQTTDTLS
jgi:hypothetical protein